MEKNYFATIKNNGEPVLLSDIPVISYERIEKELLHQLSHNSRHCIAYYGVKGESAIRFFIAVADDAKALIYLYSYSIDTVISKLPSLVPHFPALYIYEREITENFGIEFTNHPWNKPVRYAANRADKSKRIENYPFYTIEGEEIHEVGVGPVHAGIIEPGHFRFLCSGEKVLHLEIQLGYQHRGVETEMVKKDTLLKRQILSESIAGDSSIGHGLAHAQLMESLSGIQIPEILELERIMALELERIAIHIGDTSAMFTDVAYQLGQVVNEALRTMIINSTQLWCGNRFGKGFIRTGGSRYPMQETTLCTIIDTLKEVEKRYKHIADKAFDMPTVLLRFDNIGKITHQQAEMIGAVGMAARITELQRDIRASHPFQYYKNYSYEPVLLEVGDVLARMKLRVLETQASIKIFYELAKRWMQLKNKQTIPAPLKEVELQSSSFAISLTEGWRGEIVHAAITNQNGDIIHYKVKDPSFHNWMALALATREQEISDFPVCNKSFNLSYCGNDL